MPIVTKAELGLDQVNNVSDLNKPVSTAQATAIAKQAPVATVAALEAIGSTDTLHYCVATATTYQYLAAGSAYTVDSLYVLSTADGGNTRWIGVDGQYVVNGVMIKGSVGIGTFNGTTPATKLEVVDTVSTSPRGLMSAEYITDVNSVRLHLRKARGSIDAPTTVVTGDGPGKVVASGYDGSNFLENANITVECEGTIASTRVPTRIIFNTATDAAPSVLTERMRIDSAGLVTIPGNVSEKLDPTSSYYGVQTSWRTSSDGFISGVAGLQLGAVTINAAGSGYSVHDKLLVAGGNSGYVEVLTIGGGGSVTSIEVHDPGNGYSLGNAVTTSYAGAGTGCKVNITAVGMNSPWFRIAGRNSTEFLAIGSFGYGETISFRNQTVSPFTNNIDAGSELEFHGYNGSGWVSGVTIQVLAANNNLQVRNQADNDGIFLVYPTSGDPYIEVLSRTATQVLLQTNGWCFAGGISTGGRGLTLDAVNTATYQIGGTARLDGNGYHPPTLTDSAAPNNSVYYSSTASKLAYKDAGGTVHTMY